MKVDILAFGAHPDDVELGAAGTIIKSVKAGKKVVVIDLTEGELGTRGTVEQRLKEATAAAEVMGIVARENLGFRDGFFANDEVHQLAVVRMIRKYQPEVILCNAPVDRHPDHGKGSELVVTANFLAGLVKVETKVGNDLQEVWRAPKVYHYIQDRYLTPSFVVDISDEMEDKLKAIRAHGSQFFDPKSDEPETYISSKGFFDGISSRAMEFGREIFRTYGEGFVAARRVGVNDFTDLL